MLLEKMIYDRNLLLYLILLGLISCSDKPANFIVYNQDIETIDTLFISIEDHTYFIVDLQPKRTKSIYIPKMYESDIYVHASDSLPMKLPIFKDYPQKEKTIRIMITKSRVISAGTIKKGLVKQTT